MKKTNTTLLFLLDGDKILLATKKRGFGEGKWNGVGGKIESGESVEQAMLRETKEEIGVVPTVYTKMAKIKFLEHIAEKQEEVNMSVFVCAEWQGVPTESEEMMPKWFNKSDIPYNKMFPDDKIWLPIILQGNKINGYFEFDKDWNITNHKVEIVEEF